MKCEGKYYIQFEEVRDKVYILKILLNIIIHYVIGINVCQFVNIAAIIMDIVFNRIIVVAPSVTSDNIAKKNASVTVILHVPTPPITIFV